MRATSPTTTCKRLGAEQLLDADRPGDGEPGDVRQLDPRAATCVCRPGTGRSQIPDGDIESPFLELFGRPPRDTRLYEGDRTCEPSLRQALYLHQLRPTAEARSPAASGSSGSWRARRPTPRSSRRSTWPRFRGRPGTTRSKTGRASTWPSTRTPAPRPCRTCSGRFSVPRSSCSTTALPRHSRAAGRRSRHARHSGYQSHAQRRRASRRRDFLRVGSLAALGLTLADWLQAARPRGEVNEAKAKSVIQLWMGGGPSHLDTFDPKPEAGNDYCGPLKSPIATNVPGIRISELLPLMAKQADKYSIIRSFTHPDFGHETATYTVTTGNVPTPDLVYPSIGLGGLAEEGLRRRLQGQPAAVHLAHDAAGPVLRLGFSGQQVQDVRHRRRSQLQGFPRPRA